MSRDTWANGMNSELPDSEQRTATANYKRQAMDLSDGPMLSADCYFGHHDDCRWDECPCGCHLNRDVTCEGMVPDGQA